MYLKSANDSIEKAKSTLSKIVLFYCVAVLISSCILFYFDSEAASALVLIPAPMVFCVLALVTIKKSWIFQACFIAASTVFVTALTTMVALENAPWWVFLLYLLDLPVCILYFYKDKKWWKNRINWRYGWQSLSLTGKTAATGLSFSLVLYSAFSIMSSLEIMPSIAPFLVVFLVTLSITAVCFLLHFCKVEKLKHLQINEV